MELHEYMRSRGITEDMLDEARARTQARLEAYRLPQIRKGKGLTQATVAQRMGVSQKRVSELENGNIGSMRMDTLARYAESLGGKLVATIEFPDKTITLAR